MLLDQERSKELAKKIKARPKECWLNAFKAMDHLSPDAKYIEGWAVSDISYLAIEHGWIELDGAIIDPTLYQKPPAKYYPGFIFTYSEILETYQKAKELPAAWYLLHAKPNQYEEFYRPAFNQALAECSRLLAKANK